MTADRWQPSFRPRRASGEAASGAASSSGPIATGHRRGDVARPRRRAGDERAAQAHQRGHAEPHRILPRSRRQARAPVNRPRRAHGLVRDQTPPGDQTRRGGKHLNAIASPTCCYPWPTQRVTANVPSTHAVSTRSDFYEAVALVRTGAGLQANAIAQPGFVGDAVVAETRSPLGDVQMGQTPTQRPPDSLISVRSGS
jgi:hypothetical protein